MDPQEHARHQRSGSLVKEEVLESLQGRVGYRFDDLRRLEQALTHSSWAHEHDKVQDLERLEFLGDSVFNAAVTILLWRQAPWPAGCQ